MNKNYGWCPCCSEPATHTELSSTVTGYCVACEDYMKAVNPCMGCGRDFPNVMLSDNVGGCCMDCTLMEGSTFEHDYDEHPGFDDNDGPIPLI